LVMAMRMKHQVQSKGKKKKKTFCDTPNRINRGGHTVTRGSEPPALSASTPGPLVGLSTPWPLCPTVLGFRGRLGTVQYAYRR
jgi:hypothetical protein